MKKILFIISIFLISCQEEITLDIPQAETKIVVEGAIEPGFPPYVILTKNQSYFDPININTLDDIAVGDANVKVWTYNEDGSKDSTILELLPSPYDSVPLYTDLDIISNPTLAFTGEIGKTYYLEIQWNNQVFTSSTTIPTPTPLDSLWVEKNENAEKDFKYDIRAWYSDPANVQNNILIRSKRIERWKRDSVYGEIKNEADPQLILVDAGPDVLVNGDSFETFFPRPSEGGGFPTGAYNTDRWKYFEENGIQDSVYLPRDVVLIKFCQIDDPALRFWRGLIRQFASGGNPFAEPLFITKYLLLLTQLFLKNIHL